MMNEALIERGRHLWAKSDRDGKGHSLVGHLLDTGLVAARLIEQRPELEQKFFAEELGLNTAEAARLLTIVAALHDLGKAVPVFQAKWPEGAPAEALGSGLLDVPHGRISGILLRDYFLRFGYRKRLSNSLANAVAIHHGRRLPSTYNDPATFDARSLGIGSNRWEDWQSRIADDVSAAFGGLPVSDYRKYLRGRTWALLAGLTSVADWIASSLTHTDVVEDPAVYVDERRAAVDERLAGIDWPGAEPWYSAAVDTRDFASLFFSEFQPRPLQSAMAELARAVDDPALYIIEAPMGEGKTEAALFAAVQPSGARGTYMALPTQATSDAMHSRMAVFVEKNQQRPLEISLAHSGAKLRTKLPRTSNPAETETNESDMDAQSWFSQGRRELLTVIGVGTVDQALMGILPIKHFFVRLWGLAGKTVILDEIHAYDTYTGDLIAVLVEWLAAVDSSVVLMSATLPQQARQKLLSAYISGRGLDLPTDNLEAGQYPAVIRTDKKGSAIRSFDARPQPAVQLTAAPYDLEAVGELLLLLEREGGAAAVIVNTVGRAQQLYQHCKERGVQAELLHGRLPLAERQARERRIVARYGPAGAPTGRRGLVIGTQVLEQSLDLDFDVMVSDLAPIDLLFQRSGRMHRHEGRQRPEALGRPQLYVCGLHGDTPDGPDPKAVESVYMPLVMLRTALVLRNRRELRFPADLHQLVQTVYGAEELPIPDALVTAYEEAELEYQMKQKADTETAKAFSIGTPNGPCLDSWGEAGSDIDSFECGTVLTPTRLFDESVVVVPLLSHGANWSLPDGSSSFPKGKKPRNVAQFAVAAFGQQLRLQRKSLLRKLAAERPPDWWRQSRLIRYFIPLFFTDDSTAIVDDSVIWDAELGVVFDQGGKK